ncbi:MAG TPA: response regulator transcription factor [Tepidisphaeraceae bacterium]|jgi:DNA-binding NarL/FixJ family response regulator
MVASNPAQSPTTATTKSRVLLIEDHPVVSRGLAMLIDDEHDLAVCGSAGSGPEALKLISQLKPDVVILDIALGDESGLDLIKRIHDILPNLPVLALSMHDETLYAERALRAGAKGYIMKKEAMEKVMGAIRRVLDGEIFVSEKMASRMVHKLIDGGAASAAEGSPLELLSDREFEVFSLIAQGIGPSEIANRLSVSVKTVETHREHIKAKLGLRSAPELTRFALQWTMEQR